MPYPGIIPLIQQGSIIPKIIHQVFPTSNIAEMPSEIQRNIERIRDANPEWEHRLYGDEEMVGYIGHHYGEKVLRYYQRINPKYGAARADLFRYLLLYREGGVYLDIKSSLQKPLKEVLRPDDRYLLSYWRNGPGDEYEGWGLYPQALPGRGEFQQWHIIAVAGHPFLHGVLIRVLANLARYLPCFSGVGAEGIMHTTGPIAYTQAILPLLNLHACRIADSQRDLGFVYSIFQRTEDTHRHRTVFKTHYSALSESIVTLGMMDRLMDPVLGALRYTWQVLIAFHQRQSPKDSAR
jgi:hypothetical protein